MAKGTQALVQLDANFNLRAKSLAEEAVRLWDASQKLTQELLEFSHRYWELAEEAKKLDKSDPDGEHSVELRRVISDVIGTDNPSIHSRWRMIGSCAPVLRTHIKNLPSNRDALYELTHTISERNGADKLSRWIEAKKITPDTSVRDLTALRKKKPKVSAATKQRFVSVTVMLDTTYAEAAKIFVPLLDCKEVKKITSSSSFKASMRTILGEAKFSKSEKIIG